MTFFNKKEEVINIELTQYGKHLLSKGELKPVYYEFYDDDVLYDTEYSGLAEEKQDEIQERISGTPRVKTQYAFDGAETRYKEYRKRILQEKEDRKTSLQQSLEKRKNFSLSSLSLANSSPLSTKIPAWAIDVFKGKIKSVTSSLDIIGLPNNSYKLELEKANYRLSTRKRDNANTTVELQDNQQIGGSSDLNDVHTTFEDETYVQVDEDYILLHIKEDNVEILKENFDMFVYEIEIDAKTGKEIEKPLYFAKQSEQVVDGILMDDQQADIEGYSGPDYVSHYFNIYTDKEINSDILSRYLTETEKKSLSITDGYLFREEEIGELAIPASPQIESLSVEQIEDFEDC